MTVFKDGHAFVLREGEVPVTEAGEAVLDDLPRPVLGTFWPYSADERATLAGVVAGRRRVATDRSAASVADVVRANVGAEATFQEVGGLRWTGKILGSPERAPVAGDARSSGAASLAPAPLAGDLLLAQTAEGTRAVPLARIEAVTVQGEICRTSLRAEEDRGVLTLRLGWRGERAQTARVGMVYLQHGLRWIPEYRIDVDGAGRAQVKLQATLVNDLADLEKASVHLVVGVPRFEFGGETDPIALASDAADVGARMPRGARLAQAFTNSIMTQMAGYTENDAASAGGAGALGGSIGAAGANEDLFVFDVKDVTLRRGERMTLPVASFEATYTDVYTVEVAASPPPEVWQAGRDAADMDRVRALLRPAAMHKLRLANGSRFPITTAPAIVLREGRLLGQGSTVYTPAGGRCDVTVTQAVGLRVRKDDRETDRTRDAMRWRGDAFQRVNCEGVLSLCNDTDRAVEVEVTRHLLGAVDRADKEGVVTRVNAAEDAGFAAGGLRAEWWPWFNWPWWWRAVNGAGRIEWKVRVEPKTHVDLAYAWHYFWQ